ncbi:hypothetical protein [Streptomyces sp. NPDC001137]|uniref:hypothetical protein n=1 Tax=Streptomyces sp. NPDC001137 TaxID=3154378 RepID=UPI00333035DD
MSPLRWGLALSGWAAVATVAFLPEAAVLRVVVVTGFLLVCPALAAARWTQPTSGRAAEPAAVLEVAALAVVVSASLSTLVVETLFLSHTFTATRALLVLAALTSVLALLPRPGRPGEGGGRAAKDDGAATASTDRSPPSAPEGTVGRFAVMMPVWRRW